MHASFYILTCIMNNIDNVAVITCAYVYVYLKLLDVRLLCPIELSDKRGGTETDVNPHATSL